MTDSADTGKKSDYSCEILSFIVLVILSALSHFWYILFFFCAGIIVWGAVVLLGQILRSVAMTFPSQGRRLLVRVQSRTRDF
ncbi:MAG: hypothetical protein ACHP8A_15140 [Terriglobales bacterium]|jgi:hypothetical protein